MYRVYTKDGYGDWSPEDPEPYSLLEEARAAAKRTIEQPSGGPKDAEARIFNEKWEIVEEISAQE